MDSTPNPQNEISEEFFQNIFSRVGDGILLSDSQAILLEANPRSCEIFGYSRDELVGRSLWELTPADEVANVLDKLGVLAVDKIVVSESAFTRKNGTRVPVEINATLLSNGQMLGIIRDISERKHAEQASRDSAEKFRALVENSLDGIIIVNEDGVVIEWNWGQEKISGLKRSDVLEKLVWEIEFKLLPIELRSDGLLDKLRRNTQEILKSGHGHEVDQPRETTFQFPNGNYRNVEIMTYTYKSDIGYRMGSIVRDITERKQIQVRLEYLAMHDVLTGLPNRQLLHDRLNLALDRANRGQHGMLAVMLLDLDNFKDVNDTHGHAFGDQLLKLAAQRLQGCVRKTDTAARMGGDEFILINEEVANIESCILIAKKVLGTLSRPMKIEGRNFKITASIGISLYAPDNSDAVTLLRQADIAMYDAKQSHNCYRFYRPANS